MADGTPSVKRRKPECKRPSFGATHLISENGLDTINQATCMLEHLVEQMGELDGNESFGQYLLYRTITDALRHGVHQMLAEGVSHG